MNNKQFQLTETLLYKGIDGAVTGEFLIDVFNETLWASRKVVAEIFGTSGQNISKHFRNIFQEGELNENEVSIDAKKLFKDQSEFSNYSLLNSKKGGRPEKWYNLDGIISVGYRVNSKQATQFRIWATKVLKEYMIKGFVLDDELLKNGTRFGKDYFDELLERVREIRVSERRAYQKVTDLYAISYDYNDNPQITRDFFAKVQNKVIYAVTGKTAPEIIKERVNSNEINMGLTSWEGSPKTKIHASDVVISKNYLYEDELKTADKLVDGFLTTAEMKVETHRKREKPLLLKDWSELLDNYINLNDFKILKSKGNVSKKGADKIAKKEYNKYRLIQDELYQSDYDKRIEEVDIAIKRIESRNN
ncbi:MAG: virulence RhuM family protein [Methanobrevibacter sp.]|nr:virulence RhuM family protein [Methanobrevibacter sp.]